MCICRWELVAVAVVIALLFVFYSEINRRTCRQPSEMPSAKQIKPRHREGETVNDLRRRHNADSIPYYPNPLNRNTH